MNLDDRAARARDELRHHVEPGLDLDAAKRALRDTGARRTDQRRARLATGALALVAAVAGIAMLSSGVGTRGQRDPNADLEMDQDGRSVADAHILEAMPQSPIDGKQSWRLPVIVKPQTGVHDGDRATIYGRGFEPHEQLGIVHCGSEADTANDGVKACDLGSSGSFDHVEYATASSDGTVVADITIRRFITTPGGGRIDCASTAERCLIGMGAISNYDRSGGAYINFDGAPAFPEPTFTVSPNGALVPGQEVQTAVTGWVPGRGVRIEQCLTGAGEDRCETLLDGRAAPDGSFSATVAVNAAVMDDAGEAACEGHCVLRANGIGVKGGSSAPLPGAVALVFDPAAAAVTTTTRVVVTTTTTSLPDITVPPSTTPATDPGQAPTTSAGQGVDGTTVPR